MNANDVRDCLALRWPDAEYLSIAEAPERCDRGGRKIDLLVVSLWRSRGLQRDAVEIKVSYSDWTRERKKHAKADFWWQHSNRFWIAAPSTLAEKIKPELPPGWGLLSCQTGEAPKVARKPESREAEPLSWPTIVGLLRAAADCGINALQRAEARGRELGREIGLREAERNTEEGLMKRELERLRSRVEAFEAASGLSISDRWANTSKLGNSVRLIHEEFKHPGRTAAVIGYAALNLESAAERLLKQATEARNLATQVARAIDPDTEVA